jgi:anti-sigma regulatory factor (Ser/Thr protein kinase)
VLWVNEQIPVSQAVERPSAVGVVGAPVPGSDAGVASAADGTVTPPFGVSRFGASDLPALRDTVRRAAVEAGLGPRRVTDFVLAVHELAANSVMHGGGGGELRLWVEGGALVCEVHDRGELFETAALAARREARHGTRAEGGYGLWIVRQACDSTEIRQVRGQGTVVRVAALLHADAPAGRVEAG